MRRWKRGLFFALKGIVAAVLIGVLVRGKALDFGALRVVLCSGKLLAADLAVWCLCSVAFPVMRWRLLLRLAGARVPLGRAIMLQLTGVFFNIVIPGNVGGDLLKALYVARDEPAERRPTIILIAFLERFVGLAGLVALCGLVTLARLPTLWRDPLFHPMVLGVAALVVGTLAIPALGVLAVRRWGDRAEALFAGGTSFVARTGRQLVGSARLVAKGPLVLAGALGISVVNHAAGVSLFVVLMRTITGQDVGYTEVAAVYPMALLTLVLPLSPAGFGVGHMAFDRLFGAVGISGGATVFNVFLLGQLAPGLAGVVPYLALRRRLPKAEEENAEDERART